MQAYENLAGVLKKNYIESGNFSVGFKLPTVRQLALEYNVSGPTVVRAVEVLAEEGWLGKRQGSGIYIKALPDNSPQTRIGFIAGSLTFGLTHDCLTGVDYVARSRNCALEFACSNMNIEEERRQVRGMYERGVKGIVIYCCEGAQRGGDAQEYLASEFVNLPIVVVDIYYPSMKRPHVILDNLNAGREMTRYLLQQERRHIGFVKLEVPQRAIDDRLLGYKQALRDAGLSLISEHVVSFDSQTSDSEMECNFINAIEKLIKTNPRPDAIILPSDIDFPLAFEHLTKSGISVPNDITLVGFDNIQNGQIGFSWPTTNSDFIRVGERATDHLLECIASGNLEPVEVIMPCPLLVPLSHNQRRVGTKRGRAGAFNIRFSDVTNSAKKKGVLVTSGGHH